MVKDKLSSNLKRKEKFGGLLPMITAPVQNQTTVAVQIVPCTPTGLKFFCTCASSHKSSSHV